MLVEPRGKVDASNTVPALAELRVGVDRAQARSLAQIFRDAADRDGGVFSVERIAGRDSLSRLAIVGNKKSDIRVADFSRCPDAKFRMHDVARVNEGDGRDEVVGVLQEERPQLGKINREALIDGELRLFGFDIAEVGVESAVEDNAVFQDQLDLAAGGAFKVARADKGVGGIDVDEGALVLRQRVGVQLEIVRAADAFNIVERALLAEDAGDVGGHAGP